MLLERPALQDGIITGGAPMPLRWGHLIHSGYQQDWGWPLGNVWLVMFHESMTKLQLPKRLEPRKNARPFSPVIRKRGEDP